MRKHIHNRRAQINTCTYKVHAGWFGEGWQAFAPVRARGGGSQCPSCCGSTLHTMAQLHIRG